MRRVKKGRAKCGGKKGEARKITGGKECIPRWQKGISLHNCMKTGNRAFRFILLGYTALV